MSAGRFKLTMTHTDDHLIASALDQARKSSVQVRVDKRALERLYHDLGRALALLPSGYEMQDGEVGP